MLCWPHGRSGRRAPSCNESLHRHDRHDTGPSRPRPGGDTRLARLARRRHRPPRADRDGKAAAGADPPRRARGGAASVHRQHALRQHHSGRGGPRLSRRPRPGAAAEEPRPLERAGDGGAREPRGGRHRRAHLDLRLGRDPLRGRVQPLLPGRHRHAARRPRVLPGPRGAGDLRPRLSGGSDHPGAARELPARAAGTGAVVVPAPVADARLLGVPHGVDGARADHGHLPGPVPAVPGGPGAAAAVGRQGVGVRGRRRDRRARVAGGHHPGRARAARQPDLRRQLQPAAARRAGARQRADHPGARGGVPRGGVERHQGHLGARLGPAARRRPRRAARPPHERDGRRAVPEVRGRVGRVHPRPLLGGHAGPREPPDGRRAEEAAARGARPRQGPRGVRGGGGPPGQPHRHPRPHHQGLRARRGRRGPQHHPPAEEAERGRAARVPRPLRHPPVGRRDRRAAVLCAGPRHAGDGVPAGPPRGPRGAGT